MIELLWGLGIASVVLIVLWPIVAIQTGRSHERRCVDSMRSLGTAISMYVRDNDGQLMPSNKLGLSGWAGRLNPFVKDPWSFTCPDDRVGMKHEKNGKELRPVSFAINDDLEGPRKLKKSARSSLLIDEMNEPSKTVVLFEVTGCQTDLARLDEGTAGFTISPPDHVMSPSGNGAGPLLGVWPGAATVLPLEYATGDVGARGQQSSPRHHDGANYLAADGHVQWLRPERVSSGSSAFGTACSQDGLADSINSQCRGLMPTAAGTENPSYSMTFSAN